jgi:hypothetical protein
VGAAQELESGGRKLKLSNLEKVLYRDAGFTKAHAIDYYARVSGYLHVLDCARVAFPLKKALGEAGLPSANCLHIPRVFQLIPPHPEEFVCRMLAADTIGT